MWPAESNQAKILTNDSSISWQIFDQFSRRLLKGFANEWYDRRNFLWLTINQLRYSRASLHPSFLKSNLFVNWHWIRSSLDIPANLEFLNLLERAYHILWSHINARRFSVPSAFFNFLSVLMTKSIWKKNSRNLLNSWVSVSSQKKSTLASTTL